METTHSLLDSLARVRLAADRVLLEAIEQALAALGQGEDGGEVGGAARGRLGLDGAQLPADVPAEEADSVFDHLRGHRERVRDGSRKERWF